jgi:hypothetical protein
MNAKPPPQGLAQQAFQLGCVEAVTANNTAVEKEDRHIEPVTPLQHGIAVDIDDFDGGQLGRAAQCLQLGQHLVAQLTVVTMDDGETWWVDATRAHPSGGDPLVRSWL